MLKTGQIIKWNSKECKSKRRYFDVIGEPTAVEDGYTYTLSPLYKPAPKSTLRNKGFFSKFKGRLIEY